MSPVALPRDWQPSMPIIAPSQLTLPVTVVATLSPPAVVAASVMAPVAVPSALPRPPVYMLHGPLVAARVKPPRTITVGRTRLALAQPLDGKRPLQVAR